MTTILETLKNAEYNIIRGAGSIGLEIGKEQLHNAIVLLEKNFKLETDVDDLLDEYNDDIDSVPDANTLDRMTDWFYQGQ